jgi:Ca2+-transporting ATPase
MLWASIISGLLLVLVIIIPGLNEWFGVEHLSGLQWGMVCGAAAISDSCDCRNCEAVHSGN